MREFIAEIGVSDADQTAATLRNVAVHQVHAAIFGHEILNIGTQRSDHAASHERRSDLRDHAVLRLRSGGHGNDSFAVLRERRAADEVDLSAGAGILARSDALSANLAGQIGPKQQNSRKPCCHSSG